MYVVCLTAATPFSSILSSARRPCVFVVHVPKSCHQHSPLRCCDCAYVTSCFKKKKYLTPIAVRLNAVKGGASLLSLSNVKHQMPVGPKASHFMSSPLHASTKLLTEITLKENSKKAGWLGLLIKRGYYISMSYVVTSSLNTARTTVRNQARSYNGDHCVTYKAGVLYESDSRWKWRFVNGLFVPRRNFELVPNGTDASVCLGIVWKNNDNSVE